MPRQSQGNLPVRAPDQRASRRFGIRLLADGLAVEDRFDVCIRSISTDGLAIEPAVELRVGTEFELTLPISGPTRARVVWCRGSICGCLFEAPVDAAVVSAIRLKATPTTASDTRTGMASSALIPREDIERWPARVRVAILVLAPLTIWASIALLFKLVR